jgi:hypothetical protein
VLIGGMTTALALAQDLQSGMIDRFRSLPMAPPAFLAGVALIIVFGYVLTWVYATIGLAVKDRGGPVYHDLWQSVAWCLGIFAVVLAVSLGHRKGNGLSAAVTA